MVNEGLRLMPGSYSGSSVRGLHPKRQYPHPWLDGESEDDNAAFFEVFNKVTPCFDFGSAW